LGAGAAKPRSSTFAESAAVDRLVETVHPEVVVAMGTKAVLSLAGKSLPIVDLADPLSCKAAAATSRCIPPTCYARTGSKGGGVPRFRGICGAFT
jgi:hypothetical protein